jgi:transposase-like protein
VSADEPVWLTVTEIARRLGRPPTTVAYWRDTFRDVIVERFDERGHATYMLATFADIGRMMNQRTARSEIRRTLAEQQSRPPEPARSFESAVLTRLDRMLSLLERIADHLAPKDS